MVGKNRVHAMWKELEVRVLQRVTNCILINNQEILLLQKPSRGWWVAPGGKMESGESIKESVVREFYEETNIQLKNPHLRGIFTVIIEENNKTIDEWMMFTFQEREFEGTPFENSPEGKISWKNQAELFNLPMAPGDYHIFQQVLTTDKLIYGTFTYTRDFKLLTYRLDVGGEMIKAT